MVLNFAQFLRLFLQTNTYYPYGSAISSLSSGAPTVPNDYKYNGKEFVDDLGLNMLDYGARLYDPLTGRWNGVDALAEKFASHSSYHYVLGNPIRYGDRDGRDTTVYVYFDPASKYFGKGQNRNKQVILEQMRLLFSKNGIRLNVVQTSKKPDSFPEKSIDPTDQYVAYMATLPNREDAYSAMANSVGGTPSNESYNVSYVNAEGRTWNNYYKPPNTLYYLPLANTGVHEALHGYLQRAIEFLNSPKFPANDMALLDEGGHLNKPLNILSEADTRHPIMAKNSSRMLNANSLLEQYEKLTIDHKILINLYIPANYKNHSSYFPSVIIR